MSEHDPSDSGSDPLKEVSAPAPFESTGHDGVDQVLRELESLDQAPLEQHVAMFEEAQTRLRSVLDGPGREGPPVPGPR